MEGGDKGTPPGDKGCTSYGIWPQRTGDARVLACAGQILPMSAYTIVSPVPALARTSPLKEIPGR